MNGKAARNLRKLLKKELGDTLPETTYEDKKHTRTFISGTSLDGSPQFSSYEVYTRRLSSCLRALYQRAKKRHYQYQRP